MNSRKHNEPHQVYLLQGVETDYQKIGFSYNVTARMQEFNTPFELEILKVILVSNRAVALTLEQTLHKDFGDYHVRGEWFSGIHVSDFTRRVNIILGTNKVIHRLQAGI